MTFNLNSRFSKLNLPGHAFAMLFMGATMLLSTGTVAHGSVISLAGENVTISGSGPLLTSATSMVPASWTFGFPGISILDVTLSDTGLVEVNPNPSSCSGGCSWNISGDFLFTFDASAPTLTGVTLVHNDASIDSTVSFVNSTQFELAFGAGIGTTDTNFVTAQLNFAPTAAPEPMTVGVAGIGLAIIAFSRFKLKRS